MRPFDWEGMWRPEMSPWEVVSRAAIIYLFVQILVRAAGRTRLGRYRIQDIVLLFMISPALRETLVADDRSLTTAMIALSSLAAADLALGYVIHRSPIVEQLLQGRVRELVRDGRLDEKELERARITRDELLAAIRQHGHESLDEVRHAFLERSGRLSFIFPERQRRSDLGRDDEA